MTLKFFISALIACMLTSCCCDWFDENCTKGAGPVVEQELILPPFHSLGFSGSGQVFITQGDEQSVIVNGQRDVIDLIRLNVAGGHWEVAFSECVNYDQLALHITLPEITRLALSGSGDIQTVNPISAGRLDLSISGSGRIFAGVEAEWVEGRISGSGNISLTGTTDKSNFKLIGSGSVKAFGMAQQTCSIAISGSGSAEVTVTDELDVSISGSGNVFYKGNPDLNLSISGSGKAIDAN